MAQSVSPNLHLRILAIETSCDETALALVEASGGLRAPKFKILKEIVASQVKIHRPWGGVVPNLAKREHTKNLPDLFQKIFGTSHSFTISKRLKNVDLIAVTVGPGLEPALWTGITFAKDLAKKYKKPLLGVNHLEGHLYSFLLPKKTVSSKLKSQKSKLFPAIALIVSGGHTILLLLKDLTTFKKLGETRDDAVGEAFDKVARMLGLPYPGGPELEKLASILAKRQKPSINFPRPMLHDKSYDFSFSGLKTSVLYYLRDNPLNAEDLKLKADIAASFQKAAIDVLVAKTIRAAKEFKARSIILAGGVAANKQLRKTMNREAKKMNIVFLVAKQKYNTDNAVMIACAGYITHLRKKKYPLRANGVLNI